MREFRLDAKTGKTYLNGKPYMMLGWLWLNHDGSPTQLTHRLYSKAFGETTTQERYEIYARHLSMKSEYWRVHRKCAGIMHFCGLGYSRPEEPRDQTSDNFIDIPNLIFEPTFEKYMKDAFSPVGLMLNFWENEISIEDSTTIEVIAIKDTYENWTGKLTLSLITQNSTILLNEREIIIPENDTLKVHFPITIKDNEGNATLVGELVHKGDTIQSIRDITVSEKVMNE